VTTVLQYLVIAGVIGLVVFALAVFVFGRGEQLAPLSPRISPTELPDNGMTADDVRRVRFAMALRGYRMGDVDWALDRMADEVERLRGTVASLTGESPPGAAAGVEEQPAQTAGDGDESDDDPVETETGSVLSGMGRDGAGRHLRSDPDETGGTRS
jgi:DivIVA domain-containing protein